MAGGLKERVKRLRSKSVEAIRELDNNEAGQRKKPKNKPKPKPKPKPKEKKGLGTPASSSVNDAQIKMLSAKRDAVKNPEVRARLQAQIKALQEDR